MSSWFTMEMSGRWVIGVTRIDVRRFTARSMRRSHKVLHDGYASDNGPRWRADSSYGMFLSYVRLEAEDGLRLPVLVVALDGGIGLEGDAWVSDI